MLKFRVIVLLLLLLSLSSFSLTFEEAKKIALDKNRDLEISEIEVKKAELTLKESWASFYPTVSFQSSYTRLLSVPQFEMETPAGTQYISLGYPDNFRNSLEVSFPVFTFGKRLAAVKIGEKSRNIQSFEHESYKLNLLKVLAQVYYGVSALEDGVEIANKSLGRAEDHLRTARIQYKEGRITKLELLSAETELKKRETELLNASNSLDLAGSSMNIMLGLPLDTVINIEEQVMEEIDTFELDSLINIAVTRRPEVKIAEEWNKLADISKSLQYVSFLPDIFFVGSFSYDKPRGFINEWDNDMSATIAVSLPIFQGFSRLSKIGKYGLSVEQSLIREKIVKENIKKEMKDLLLGYRLNKQNLKLADEQLNIAKEAYEMAEKQYEAGYMSALEYKDRESGYRSAELFRLIALYNLIVSKEQIKIATMMD